MKRLTLTALALVALLGIGLASIAGAAPKGGAKPVKTKLTLKYTDSTDPYSESKFSGRAKTKKVCRPNRKVSIKGVGKAKTNRRGGYSISAGSGVAPGTYRAVVKKRVIKKNGNRVVCKKGKSKPVTVS